METGRGPPVSPESESFHSVTMSTLGLRHPSNDVGGMALKPFRLVCPRRILISLSGSSSVSTDYKPGGVIPARPGLLRED